MSASKLRSSTIVSSNSGRIAYSYASGANLTDTLTNIDISGFAGSKYTSYKNVRNRGTGVISMNGNSSGFVFTNSGSIEDSYSNILIYGSKATGFVYENSGSINNTYTLSSVRLSDSNNYPYIGMHNENRVTNNTGKITNSYFLKAIKTDFGKTS